MFQPTVTARYKAYVPPVARGWRALPAGDPSVAATRRNAAGPWHHWRRGSRSARATRRAARDHAERLAAIQRGIVPRSSMAWPETGNWLGSGRVPRVVLTFRDPPRSFDVSAHQNRHGSALGGAADAASVVSCGADERELRARRTLEALSSTAAPIVS